MLVTVRSFCACRERLRCFIGMPKNCFLCPVFGCASCQEIWMSCILSHACPTVFWSLVFCPSDHFRATMTVVKRRPVRDTNLHHRHDALTPRKKIEARRRRARLRRLSKLAQDALAVAILVLRLVERDGNLNYENAQLILLSARLHNIHKDILNDIVRVCVNVSLLEYSLAENRRLSALDAPRNRFINDLDPHFARNYTRYTVPQLQKMNIHLRIPDVVV